MSVTALFAKQIYTPAERIEDGCVLIEDARIHAVGARAAIELPRGARAVDLGSGSLVPGFVDVHIHGAGGHDVMEGSREALLVIGQTLLGYGTTAYLATTVTAPRDETLRSLDRLSRTIAELRREAAGEHAQCLGIHLEGPFISHARRGVHPAEHIQPASPKLLEQMLTAAQGEVRILTLAPEIEGADELIDLARRRGVIVSLGHTDATHEQALRAIARGASHAVHLFNAMRPFHHRETGVLGAVLTDSRVTAELIADGVHVEGAALRLALAAKGREGIILVSDGTSATGMPDGQYRLGTMTVNVAGGVCRSQEGKLAGSVLTLDRAVRNIMALAEVEFAPALALATQNPARLLGLAASKGSIRPGADADLVCLDSNLCVSSVMVGGRRDSRDSRLSST